MNVDGTISDTKEMIEETLLKHNQDLLSSKDHPKSYYELHLMKKRLLHNLLENLWPNQISKKSPWSSSSQLGKHLQHGVHWWYCNSIHRSNWSQLQGNPRDVLGTQHYSPPIKEHSNGEWKPWLDLHNEETTQRRTCTTPIFPGEDEMYLGLKIVSGTVCHYSNWK